MSYGVGLDFSNLGIDPELFRGSFAPPTTTLSELEALNSAGPTMYAAPQRAAQAMPAPRRPDEVRPSSTPMDIVNASLAAANPSGALVKEPRAPLAPNSSIQDQIAYYSKYNDPEFQRILGGGKDTLSKEAKAAQYFQTELAKGRTVGDIIASGIGLTSKGSNPKLDEYTRRLGGSPAYITIPNSSSSAAQGMVGHDDSAKVFFNPGEGVDLEDFYHNLAGKGTWSIPEDGGTAGAYDIVFTPKGYEQTVGAGTVFGDYLMPVAQAVMSYYNPVAGAAFAATKGVAGEKLTAGDIAAIVGGGLQATGAITAPTAATATTAATEGTGLLGLNYSDTIKGLDAVASAAEGDGLSAAVGLFGEGVTDSLLDKAGMDLAFFDDLGIQRDDFVKGVTKTEQKLAEGESLEDALLSGVGKYIEEGGSVGSFSGETPEFLKTIEDVARTALSAVDDYVLQPVSTVVQAVVDPVVDTIKEVAPKVEDTVREVGSIVDDTILQPVSNVVQAVVDPIVDTIKEVAPKVEDTVREVGSIVDDTILQPAYDAINTLDNFIDDLDISLLPDTDFSLPEIDVSLPDVSLPEIDVSLPDVSLPEIDLPTIDIPLPDFSFSGGGNRGASKKKGVSLFGDATAAEESQIDPALFELVNRARQFDITRR